MEESHSDAFYAALAMVRFGRALPDRDDVTGRQAALLAMWARAGYDTGLLPPRDALPLAYLRPWANTLMILDRREGGWCRHSVGSGFLWLLGVEEAGPGGTQESVPTMVRGLVQQTAIRPGPGHCRCPHWSSLGGADLSLLALPVGADGVVDRVLVSAASLPRCDGVAGA